MGLQLRQNLLRRCAPRLVFTKIRLASADGEVFGSLFFSLGKTSQHATPRMVCSRDPSELVPGDSWSAPKVSGVAKGTPVFFLVAFCALAGRDGNPSNLGLDRSKFPDDGTVGSQVAPDKIQTKWWPTHSRERSDCRVHWMLWASQSLQSQKDWHQRCSKVSVQLKRDRWQPNSKSVRPSSSVPRTGCPVWRKNASPNMKLWTQDWHGWCHSCHHCEWGRGPCCGDQPIASQSCIDGGRMRGAPEETDQISFRPISRHARGGAEHVRVGAGARSPVRSHADSHRPGKFSCPEVESFQPVVKALHSRIVRWCKSVGARYGHRGVRVGEATNPGPPKRLHRILASVFRSTNRFEILSSEDDLEVFATVPASSGAVRAVQEARESQPRGQSISQVAKSVRSSRRCRTRRLRALPWSWDSDTESADERIVARRVESQGTVVESVDDEQPLGRDSTHGPRRPRIVRDVRS